MTATFHSIETALRNAINQSDLSQNQMAAAAGISSAQLSRFTSGQRDITLQTAARLCSALGLQLVPMTATTPATAAAPKPRKLKRLPQADLDRCIIEAIEALAKESRLPPFVSLADLRQRVTGSRDAVDGVLNKLRMAGRISLSISEGRHRMTAAESAACITIDGRKHLLCQLTTSKPNPK
jgi:transcriptional regulator with XRE-family HTH domain